MAGKKRKNKQGEFGEACSSVISGTISVGIFLLFIIFPLFYDDGYFNILETKYHFLYIVIVGMAAVCLLLGLAMLTIDVGEFGGTYTKSFFGALKPENWKKTFHLADVGVFSFWVICAISTLCSNYRFEAFWGNEGRYSGLFLTSLYVLLYWLISRFWKLKGWHLQAFLVGGLAVCIIGITDYFKMDILTFRTIIDPRQEWTFVSTIGNINTYTAYVAMIMAVSGVLFATEKKLAKSLWYFACMTVSFVAIIMGCSDNAYLAIGALFAVLPFFLFKEKRGTLCYLIMIATFATTIQGIDYINGAFGDKVIGVDSLFSVLVNFPGLLFVVIILWLAVAVLVAIWKDKLNDPNENQMGKVPIYSWSVFVVFSLLLVVYMWFDANIMGNGERYGQLSGYLVFSDQWGTSRGYIWRKCIEIMKEFPFYRKLIGHGPDTFGIITTKQFYDEMVHITGQTFDSAHNEYLQFMVTTGILGLASYLVFLFGAGKEMVVGWKKNPYILACFFGLLCYSVQALVNLNLPISVPFMWLLLSMGVAGTRAQANKED